MANRKIWLVVLVIVLALVLAGCSRADPKDLAKQTYDITVEIMANPLKAAGSLVKAASIGKKVSKLSPADRQIYDDELVRLTGSDAGGIGILNGLLGGQEAGGTGILNGLLGGQEAGDLNSILGGLMGADSASVKEALNSIMEAIGAFNSNGTEATQ